MRFTSLRALVGGRVAFNTRASFVSFAILEQRRLCACTFERYSFAHRLQAMLAWIGVRVSLRWAGVDYRRVCVGLVVGSNIQCSNEGGGRGCGAQAGFYLLVAS